MNRLDTLYTTNRKDWSMTEIREMSEKGMNPCLNKMAEVFDKQKNKKYSDQ